MRILLFFFLLCLSTIAPAQKVDSIKTILNKTKTDSTKTLLLSALTDELTRSNAKEAVEQARAGLALARKIDFDKGIFENSYSLASAFQGQALFDSAVLYFHLALHTAEKRDDVAGQADVCSGLGHSFMRKYSMDSSRHYLEKGLGLAKKINHYKIEAGIYNNYGNVYLEESNYQKALDYFIQAAKLYENPLNDEKGQCLALSNIGNVEYRLGNYDQALDYANQSMAIAQRKSFTSSIGYAHKLLGRIYRKQKKYDSALVEYSSAQRLYLKLEDKRSAAEVLQNIGNIYFDKEQLHNALINYQQSLTLAKSVSSKTLVAFAYSAIGQAYAVLNKNDDALLYLDSAARASKVINNAYLLMDTYNALSTVYEARGNYKKALQVHQQFAQVKDSIVQSENRQLAEETQAKYELEKKEAQITLLTKDQELKTLALQRQHAIQIGSVVALLLVVVIALLLVNRYRVLNRAKRQAEIEQVRNTIARDLHDDIGSTLSTINIISSLAMRENSSGNNIHLSRIAEQSSKMMESMTDMVWSINPINDSIEKVMVKMKVFAAEILEPKNITVRFFGEESLIDLSLDSEKRKNLFLIFKESINNAAKYSQATAVTVTLKQSEGKLIMTVSDNGKGFVKENIKTGNGLINLKSRANAMRAEFKLSTAESKGTHIELVLPIT